MQDVKNVYHKEFDAALQEYNAKQTRPERRIGDYFEHVSETEQDMAVEVIIQCGDKKFWEQNSGDKIFMKQVYKQLLLKLQEYLLDFKIEKLSTDKIGLEADILVLNHKKSTTQRKLDELDGEIESSNIFLKALRQIKQFIQSYLPFAPLIEEFANHVERGRI